MALDNWNSFQSVFNILYRDTVESNKCLYIYLLISCWRTSASVGSAYPNPDWSNKCTQLWTSVSLISWNNIVFIWNYFVFSSWLFRETWLTQLQHLNGLFSISRWQKNQNANWYFPIFQEFSRINLNLFWLFVECCCQIENHQI